MRTLYIECNMGAAGDMLSAALLDLFENREEMVEKLNQLHLPSVTYKCERVTKCGVGGNHMHVYINGEEEGELHHHHHHDHEHEHDHDHHHHHHHSGLHDIEHIVCGHSALSAKVQKDVMNVYQIIAQAESTVHGEEMEHIHFHEVGTMDAIADVSAVCYLMNELHVDRVVVSPIATGSGTVKCAHGLLPVPAPATALILKDVPIYSGDIKAELCTPTGAALLKHFANDFGSMPAMKIKAVGYGMGTKDFEKCNCVRVFLGETEDETETVLELSCNVDDMSAEEISYATERLMEEGALDVYTIAIGMKKNRPGTLIRVMTSAENRNHLVEALFRYTSTIGIRETKTTRYVLNREMKTLNTSLGDVDYKEVTGYGVKRYKYEYADLAKIAREKNISIAEARRLIEEEKK